MENHHDDIILPEVDVEIHAEPPVDKRRKKTTLIIAGASLAFLALAGALVFVIVKSSNKDDVEEAPKATIEDNFIYNDGPFNETISQAETNIRTGDYLAAQELLRQYTRPERMTSTQRYRYYSALASLYAENAMDDQKLHDKYADLANRNLEAIQKGE